MFHDCLHSFNRPSPLTDSDADGLLVHVLGFLNVTKLASKPTYNYKLGKSSRVWC
jgi:hypothetical protein